MTELSFDEYFTPEQLGIELGKLGGKPLKPITLWTWRRDGKGPPATKIGRHVLYYKPSVEKWIRDQEVAA